MFSLEHAVFLESVMRLRRFYLRTSRDLKRIEGTSRSPVFACLATTMAGLPTVRAYGLQEYPLPMACYCILFYLHYSVRKTVSTLLSFYTKNINQHVSNLLIM